MFVAINVSIKANQAVYGWLIRSLADKQKNIESRMDDGPVAEVANSISLLWLVMSEILAIICQASGRQTPQDSRDKTQTRSGPYMAKKGPWQDIH